MTPQHVQGCALNASVAFEALPTQFLGEASRSKWRTALDVNTKGDFGKLVPIIRAFTAAKTQLSIWRLLELIVKTLPRAHWKIARPTGRSIMKELVTHYEVVSSTLPIKSLATVLSTSFSFPLPFLMSSIGGTELK